MAMTFVWTTESEATNLSVLVVLSQSSNPVFFLCVVDVDSPCAEFDHGTPLHIAASNLSVEAVRVLLQNGANPHAKDDLGRTPLGKRLRCLATGLTILRPRLHATFLSCHSMLDNNGIHNG